MPSPDEREGRRQTHVRDVNEWIEGAEESVGLHRGTDSFRCECGDTGCSHVIELTRAEYEWVRASATRFALATNHEHPGDRVVAEHERYTVVEKLVGRQSRRAVRSYER
jgi:hypothetical protein